MNKKELKRKVIRYFRRTFRNKVVAIAMLILGVLSTKISNDATFLVFISIIAVPLFFVGENWILSSKD